MTTDLTAALHKLEGLLASAGAAIVVSFRSHISELEVRDHLATQGLTPTAELVEWYGWHDGAGAPGTPSLGIELAPGGEFYDISYLCGECAIARQVASEVASAPGAVLTAAELWPPSWFPLIRLSGKGFVLVDLARPDRSDTPVHVVWHDDDVESGARVAWPSIKAFVDTLIDRFESGVYTVDSAGIVQGPGLDYPE